MVKIEFIGTKDRMLYHTYVDHSLRNHQLWQEIVTQPTRGFIVKDLKIKDAKKLLINADHAPTILADVDSVDQLVEILKEQWQAQDMNKSQFHTLFE